MNCTLSIVFRCTNCVDNNRPLPPRDPGLKMDTFLDLGSALKHLKEFPEHNIEPAIEVEG